MNANMEFNVKFDDDNYIITLKSSPEKLFIIVEEEKNSVYWKKELDQKAISDITSQMGSYKSLEVFTKMLLCALSNENENITLNFCSLNEIQQLSENKKQKSSHMNNSNASFSNNNSINQEPENNIKKYLMLIYTQFEKVVYPIQLEYLDKNPDNFILYRTINRLKKKLCERGDINSNEMSTNKYIVNYNEYEQLKNENKSLINKIKILENSRQPGAVENDDIYKNYSELNIEFEEYKNKSESKIKMLLKSIDDLKESQFRESKNSFHEKDISKTKINNLEQKLKVASDIVANERRQGQIFIDEKNKQIEALKKEIRTLKDNEKVLKAKISRLEKDLESANRASSYYQYGKSPRSTKSYRTSSDYSNSYASGCSSKKSAKSSSSYLKKNLIPNNPYNKYKGLRSKNYKPFSFMENKKYNSGSSYNKKNYSNKKNNYAESLSGKSSKSKSKSRGSMSYKSNNSSVGSNSSAKKNKNNYNYVGSRVYGYNNLNKNLNSDSNNAKKPFVKAKIPVSSGINNKKSDNTLKANNVNNKNLKPAGASNIINNNTVNKDFGNNNFGVKREGYNLINNIYNNNNNDNMASFNKNTFCDFSKPNSTFSSIANTSANNFNNSKNESINISDRLGRIQSLINQASK